MVQSFKNAGLLQQQRPNIKDNVIAQSKFYVIKTFFEGTKWRRECIKLYIDYQAAIYNVKNNTINLRSKHIDIKYQSGTQINIIKK